MSNLATRHLKTRVQGMGRFGTVEVSTIDLAIHGWGASGMETCLFWGDNSEVVGWYAHWEEAVAAHEAWSNPHVLNHVLSGLEAR